MSIDILTTGLVLSVAGTIIMYLKDAPKFIWHEIRKLILFTVVIYQKDELFEALEWWLYKNHSSKYKDVEAKYGGETSDTISKELKLRHSDTVFSIKWKGKRIWFHALKEKLPYAQNAGELFSVRFHIWGLRKKKEILDMLNCITEEYNKKNDDGKIEIRTFTGMWCFFNKKFVKPIDKIILAPDIKSFLLDDIDKFVARENWYVENSIPYKRNYVFFGDPGTGKSSLALAIASYLKKSVSVLTPNSINSDNELNDAFKNLSENTILLIEDIDSCFVQRDNQKDSKFSFSSFLNCMDGSMSKHGLIVIMTTNHIERLDEALLRWGRTDVKLEIPPSTTNEIENYLRQFYSNNIITLGNYQFSIPISTVQEICIRNDKNFESAVAELYRNILLVNTKVA